MLSVALLTLVATGCYRATGLQRDPLVAEVIPETGGDRVAGLKSTAGPGDYFLGNDFVQVAIDGTVFGSSPELVLAGAASGGSIVDAGYVLLDSSFRRISAPGDVMERLTPVVNQDPSLELVFDSYMPQNLGNTSMVVMQGHLLDPNKSIAGATWDGQGRVKDVSVTHTVSLNSLDRFFTLQTIISNTGSANLGILNIADFLAQRGGGYRFAVPATYAADGSVLSSRWGMQIPGDGSAFKHPLASAVKAPMVGLLGAELGSGTMDSHTSVGLLPVDADNFLVTSDPQDPFKQLLPVFPGRIAVGSLPVAGLAAGASLTHNRRLYVKGGVSTDAGSPAATMGLFNSMDYDRYFTLRAQDFGYFMFTASGTAQSQGPLPAEIRIERNVSTTATPLWELQRLEWLEPPEGAGASSTLDSLLPVGGKYRVVIRNQNDEYTKSIFTNSAVYATAPTDESQRYLPQPILIQSNLVFQSSSSDILSPEADKTLDAQGNSIASLFSIHSFVTHEHDSPNGSLQPMRITLAGTNNTPDPVMRRRRTVGTLFAAVNGGPELSSAMAPGQYQFRGNNELFGTGFTGTVNTTFAWLPNPAAGTTSENTYTAFGTRGPLSHLEQEDLSVFEGQSDTAHSFTVWPIAVPAGWTSFDMPGPSQATTGGYNPGEMLASALAEGVQVVGRTELDQQVDALGLYNDFRWEFGSAMFNDAMRPASLSDVLRVTALSGSEPFVVGARSSNLPGYGTVTALFTPAATAARLGGARLPKQWTLADFITQAQGQFNVINRPRGNDATFKGLFTQQGFNPAVAIGTGVNSWWNGGGSYAFGQTNGGFDALELLRGEGFDGSNPDPWFAEFQAVRADWFALLNQQLPGKFTKAVGLSSALFSLNTPVGLARTYLKAAPTVETDLSGVLAALKAGAAVVSTGPFLDVSVGSAGPGGLVTGPAATVTLKVNLTATNWMPVSELRVTVNGVQVPFTVNGVQAPATLNGGWYPAFDLSGQIKAITSPVLWSGTLTVPMASTGRGSKGSWIVVEAGVGLGTKLAVNGATTGASAPLAQQTPWNRIMRGIYPIAVTNPIFVDVSGAGYSAPGL